VRRCLCGKVGCARHGTSSGWAAYKAKHPERAAFYASSTWRVMRDRQLKANPTCVVCGEPAGHVDHVLAIALGGSQDGRLQSMCVRHHHDKTVRDSHEAAKQAKRRRQRGG
jgi:5-methylcytosine-specific restriction endonuclease McrA